jgi:hypothetical protein
MSDTRTIAELARHTEPKWYAEEGFYRCGCGHQIQPGVGTPVGAGVTSLDWRVAEHRLAQIAIPAPSTIAVPHTPEEIWAAADVWCDLDFWDKDHLEYTPDGVLHLASNVDITADREHLPVELRPDIGVDF